MPNSVIEVGQLQGPLARTGCFIAGTRIWTRNGLKAIESVQIGDFVLSQPEMTGEQGYRRVNDTFIFEDKVIYRVEYVDEQGNAESTYATPNHPFFVRDIGWTGAEYLKVGDSVVLHDSSSAIVSFVGDTGQLARVYNFEVDGFHTYYVGQFGIWVHNVDCGQVIFENQLPHLLQDKMAVAAQKGITPVTPTNPAFDGVINQGTIKYAVTQDGQLFVMPMHAADGTEISHAVLTGGRPVIAAGEADVMGNAASGYFGGYINTNSGHFLYGASPAQNAAVEAVARQAFAKYGVYFPGP